MIDYQSLVKDVSLSTLNSHAYNPGSVEEYLLALCAISKFTLGKTFMAENVLLTACVSLQPLVVRFFLYPKTQRNAQDVTNTWLVSLVAGPSKKKTSSALSCWAGAYKIKTPYHMFLFCTEST